MTTNWSTFFASCTERELEGISLLRVIECTNGCIQHAFRENDPRALPIEETRTAMKFSMGLMKELAFDLAGEHYEFSPQTGEGLREIRDLYVRAFKQGDEAAMDDFFASSFACVRALGTERIQTAGDKVRESLGEILPEHTVTWGVNYLRNLLSQAEGR